MDYKLRVKGWANGKYGVMLCDDHPTDSPHVLLNTRDKDLAYLLANAPELLDALKVADKLIKAFYIIGEIKDNPKDLKAMKTIEAALAKAEGE